MRDLSELNINEGGRHVRRLPPSDETIGAFQARFGVMLPDDYLKLLRFSNGGHPELDSIEPASNPGATQWTVNMFYHLDNEKMLAGNLWAVMEQWQQILGKDAIPFAGDAGGNQFFLDLKTSPAAVKLCVHDDNFTIIHLTPTFEAFIDGLSIDHDMI